MEQIWREWKTETESRNDDGSVDFRLVKNINIKVKRIQELTDKEETRRRPVAICNDNFIELQCMQDPK